jgi:hypothetical protein
LEVQSEKAVTELALLTKKAARSHAMQEHKLKCEEERAAVLEIELERTNTDKLILIHERKKGMPIPNF